MENQNQNQPKDKYSHLLVLEDRAEIELKKAGLSKMDVMCMLGNGFKTTPAEFQIIGFDRQTKIVTYRNGLNSTDTANLDEIIKYR